MDASYQSMEGQQDEVYGREADIFAEKKNPTEAMRGDATVMPVADVMNLLQVMREEQLDSLKSIADGVQQLQSQVMVLGESVGTSERKTSLVLDRLAGLEVRIGSIPVPIKPASDRSSPYRVQQQQPRPLTDQDLRSNGGIGVGVGGGVVGNVPGTAARIPDYTASAETGSPALAPSARKVPLPPPATVAEPGRVPSWQQGRGEPEPARPHFMRNSSPKQGQSRPATDDASASIGSDDGGVRESVPSVSPEMAAKEAKRLAFMEDRARIQARIASSKGGGGSTNTAQRTPTPTTQEPEKVQTQQPLGPPPMLAPPSRPPSVFDTPAGGGGAFSGSPSFLDATDDGGEAVVEAGEEEDKAAAWLEREKAERDKRERARKEEEERIERQRAEAERRRQEQEAQKAREAAEARAREEARREAEVKKQAKTRSLMSSLFDKEEDDGNSLFGGLGGVAIPVFTDDNHVDDFSRGEGLVSRTAPEEKKKAAAAAPPVVVSNSSVPSPLPLSGGGLFGGIEEPAPVSLRGGLFDSVEPPVAERSSSPRVTAPSLRKGDSGGSGLFLDDADLHSSQPGKRPGAGDDADGDVGGMSTARSDGYSGLFDSSPAVGATPSSKAVANAGAAGAKKTYSGENDAPTDEVDDFLSTLEAVSAFAPSGTTMTETAGATDARGSIFGDDLFSANGGSDDIFSSAYTTASSRGRAGPSSAAASGGGSGGSSSGAVAGKSLFDRPEFSIDSGDDDVGNVFGGSGGSGVAQVGRSGTDKTSFLTALGDADLSVGGDGGGDADEEGMVEVRL